MKVELSVKQDLVGFPAGSTKSVECDKTGIPLDEFWRRRLKDGSCEVAKKEKRSSVKGDE
jgi:hypothetical protein